MNWTVRRGLWPWASIKTLVRLCTFAGPRACFGFLQPNLLPTEPEDTELALQLLLFHGQAAAPREQILPCLIRKTPVARRLGPEASLLGPREFSSGGPCALDSFWRGP